MKKKKTLTKCPKCGSGCLWYKPDGFIVCMVCMNLYDKEGNLCKNLRDK